MPPYQQLYVLQCAYHRLPSALAELSNLTGAQDSIILLEDAVFALHAAIQTTAQLYVLHSDAHLIPAVAQNQVKCIDYSDWADLLLQADKVITWK
jgi:sulfur relay protein TusB/DsrH